MQFRVNMLFSLLVVYSAKFTIFKLSKGCSFVHFNGKIFKTETFERALCVYPTAESIVCFTNFRYFIFIS